MIHPVSKLAAAVVTAAAPSPAAGLGTCPLCHTSPQSVTAQTLSSGEGWRCVRCGQQWDARRLAAVEAYAAWTAAHRPL